MLICKVFIGIVFASLMLVSCSAKESKGESQKQPISENPSVEAPRVFEAPASIPTEIIAKINEEKGLFLQELETLLREDADDLLILVDKTHFLPATYAPPDLVRLSAVTAEGRSYSINREDLSLRRAAEAALEKMAAAACNEGVSLLASSTYRSYEYQENVYRRNVAQLGQAAADRESAKPGASQHQLGTVVDFGSITDEFAQTRAGRWLDENAHLFGWSLSFPQGYEEVTGYRWESWHYRYLGVAALEFQRKWFNNIQQYMLEFIHAWKAFQGA